VANRFGASLVVALRPTGEISSSATVNSSRMPTMPHSGAVFSPPGISRKAKNAMPISVVPAPNLSGVTGCRSPSLVHRAAKAPASTMMNTGLMLLTHETGISQPNRSRSRRLSA
jgi:hypothetical protein